MSRNRQDSPGASNSARLQVAGLRKSYGEVAALDGVDLELEPGEICGLLGPNGAGKTTLVSIVCGLRLPDDGSVVVNGVDALNEPHRARQHIGLAPQDIGIYPTLTVEQNLVFFGQLASLADGELRRRIANVAEVLDLSHLLGRAARMMSGGEQRRLHAAIAMLHDPPLLLLDEPTSGVDVGTRIRLLQAVRHIAAERGTSVCYSTHYLPEVETLGASVAIIDRGKVVVRGSVASLVAQHGSAAFELHFDGKPPDLATTTRHELDNNVLRVFASEPAAASAAMIADLGVDAQRLRSVKIIMPSLETAFMSVTGYRYEGGETSEDIFE